MIKDIVNTKLIAVLVFLLVLVSGWDNHSWLRVDFQSPAWAADEPDEAFFLDEFDDQEMVEVSDPL